MPLDEFEMRRIIDIIPVRPSRDLPPMEASQRVSDVLRLLDIDASVDDRGGVVFGGEGLSVEDQPLTFAVLELCKRRFGQPVDPLHGEAPNSNTAGTHTPP